MVCKPALLAACLASLLACGWAARLKGGGSELDSKLPPGASASDNEAGPLLPRAHRQAKALVLMAVGDSGQHASWLANASCGSADFDVALIYYGSNPFFTCNGCKHVWFLRGAKWHLVYLALNDPEAWQQISRYDAVMLADDDLLLSADDLSQAFAVFSQYQLQLAQISVCRQNNSHSAWDLVYQRPDNLLRYTSFVEVMAPIVSNSFLPQLRTLLEDSYTGWGLDFLMPFALGYPRDQVAIIDGVCMVHPLEPPAPPAGRAPRQRMYSAQLPRSPRDEWDLLLSKYGVTREAVQLHGLRGFPPMETFGAVPLEAWQPDASAQCGAPARQLMDELELSELPAYSLASWVLQVVLMSCGVLAVAVKVYEAARGRRQHVLPAGPGVGLKAGLHLERHNSYKIAATAGNRPAPQP